MRILKSIWYFYFWTWVRVALSVYYRTIKISGKENIPKNVSVIYAANHENALIDPLVMTTRFPKNIYYLVRADVFKKTIIRKFLNSLNLLPVYRIRDGANSVKANQAIFKNCFEAFKKGYSLMLFPEGSHDMRRVERVAKKGISRIALGALNEPDAPKELYIVPVGMNYSAHKTFRSAAHVVFGKPIKIEKADETNENLDKVKTDFEEGLKHCHVSFPIDKFEVLDKIFFHNQRPEKVVEPDEINEQARELVGRLTSEKEKDILEVTKKLEKGGMRFPFQQRSYFWWNGLLSMLLAPLAFVGMLIHAPALLAAWYIMKGIKDKVFMDTIYYGIGLALVPSIWIVIGVIVWSLTAQIGFVALSVVFAFLTLIVFESVKKNWQIFTSNLRFVRSDLLQEQYLRFTNLIESIKKG